VGPRAGGKKVIVTQKLNSRFTPGNGPPVPIGWVGFRADLDAEARRKILRLCQGSKPGRPVCSQTLTAMLINVTDNSVLKHMGPTFLVAVMAHHTAIFRYLKRSVSH
jgi:hypothetical protein